MPGSGVQMLRWSAELITSAKKIAQHMNEFILNKVETIRAGMASARFVMNKVHDIMSTKTCSLQLCHVSLLKLSNSRSTGTYWWARQLLCQTCCRPYCSAVHHIVSLSIIQKKFPQSWKYLKVIPLHKKEDVLERKNYRPVAILSLLYKVLENLRLFHKE